MRKDSINKKLDKSFWTKVRDKLVEMFRGLWERISRETFVVIMCGASALVFFAAVVVKLLIPDLLPDAELRDLLIALAVMTIIPCVSQFEMFGVKVETRKKIEELGANIRALPDYILGSEYENDGDCAMAERSYRASLE